MIDDENKVATKLQIVKLGGSLLSFNDCQSRIRHWCASDGANSRIWIVGGGKIADQIRNWYDGGIIGNDASHELACKAMSLTANLLSHWMPDWPLDFDVERLLALAVKNQSDAIFDPANWVLKQCSIPKTWDVTSDSIAGYLARHVRESLDELAKIELILLKSTLNPANDLVDNHFNELKLNSHPNCIAVRLINLGDHNFNQNSDLGLAEFAEIRYDNA